MVRGDLGAPSSQGHILSNLKTTCYIPALKVSTSFQYGRDPSFTTRVFGGHFTTMYCEHCAYCVGIVCIVWPDSVLAVIPAHRRLKQKN